MLNAVPRHNVNLTQAELQLVIRGALGRFPESQGRVEFEAAACRYFGTAHATAIESGRSALYLALLGLNLPDGATIILPNYCFFSLIKVVEGMGYSARFTPVDPETFAIDPVRLKHHIDGADAVVTIHPFGQLVDIAELHKVCSDAGIPLVEDASQATGARWERRRAGAIGDVGVFSLVSGKNLQTFGGGLLVTHRADIHRRVMKRIAHSPPTPAEHVQTLFRSGLQRWFLTTPLGYRGFMHPITLGLQTWAPDKLEAMVYEERATFNPDREIRRLSDVQGTLGCMELLQLDRRNEIRRSNALRLLQGLQGLHGIQLPRFDSTAENSFNAVAIRTKDARWLAHRLRRRGFDTRPDYMEWFGDHPDFEDEVVYLPNHPGMNASDIDRLVQTVRDIMSD